MYNDPSVLIQLSQFFKKNQKSKLTIPIGKITEEKGFIDWVLEPIWKVVASEDILLEIQKDWSLNEHFITIMAQFGSIRCHFVLGIGHATLRFVIRDFDTAGERNQRCQCH